VTLIRLLRILSLGGKTVGTQVQAGPTSIEVEEEKPEILIRVVEGDLQTVTENVTWAKFSEYLSDNNQQWIDVSNVTEKDFDELSIAFEIPEAHFESKLVDEGYSRIDYLERLSLVFLQEGQVQLSSMSSRHMTIAKTGFLIICSGKDIVTVHRRRTGLFESVLKATRKRINDNSLVVVVLYCIMDYIIKKYRSTVNDVEMELVRLESFPSSRAPPNFLETTFQLKKEVSGLGSNLLHLKEILALVVSKRVPLEGFNHSWEEMFDLLQDEAGFLQESADNAKDNLLSIIDLHINRTSYETNKILKILAVITVLGVIPSMIGGILGENLLDAPFQAYLWQIVAFVMIIMCLTAYIFIKLGWLKS
jgi:Mg2+ and Co2+ transporter CorA